MSYQLAIDIGGTFTDLYLRDTDGGVNSIKVPTTEADLTEGLMNAITAAAEAERMDTEALLSEADRLVHGTTVSTNAIIEDDVSTTALICTDGFRDTLWFREGGKEKPYDWDTDYPDPYISRSLTYGVDERVNAEGEVVSPLDEEQAREVVQELAESDVDAVAVSLLWSHTNPVHERTIGEIIEDLAPGLHYSLSHEINPVIREYRRTSSTAIDASLFNLVSDYLANLDAAFTDVGYEGDPLIITSNGGVMEAAEISRTPIWTVDSGPTMLPVGTHSFTQAELDEDNVIALDMGGTSLDMGVVRDGDISRSREAEVGDDYMLGIEKVEVESIGSGGGSIAWVDEGGLLHVGPESAGADPGPVCYMQGGDEPTLTDAALVLGYLNEEYFLGGEMDIDKAAAEAAIEREIADELGVGVQEAAYSIYATANQDIVNGIEGVTIERGIDPRNYVLSGGGGALGVHAVEVARELQIDEILLPRGAGVISSIGGVVSDIRRDFSGSHFTTGSDFDHDEVNELLASLEDQAQEFLDRTAIPDEDQSLTFYTEARYPHQVWELEVELPFERLDDGNEQELMDRFRETHEETYGFKTEEDVEFLYWRVEAKGETGQTVHTTQPEPAADESVAPHSERDAFIDHERVSTPAYRAAALAPGVELDGPAFVDADNMTVVLPPDSELTVTERGNYHIRT
ncbi:hydantoinase/oxoprolinase family protein [Natronococcus wangiae]|uniref:hydantoinase/oxoprolinase family protein n=1 Tax=Natronococcus wangiae TaxID=3068275 RepID=UPI00273D405E|nr:hydantoinase/oxoprolinase family protein [Natronococcus sp. AD5]